MSARSALLRGDILWSLARTRPDVRVSGFGKLDHSRHNRPQEPIDNHRRIYCIQCNGENKRAAQQEGVPRNNDRSKKRGQRTKQKPKAEISLDGLAMKALEAGKLRLVLERHLRGREQQGIRKVCKVEGRSCTRHLHAEIKWIPSHSVKRSAIESREPTNN